MGIKSASQRVRYREGGEEFSPALWYREEFSLLRPLTLIDTARIRDTGELQAAPVDHKGSTLSRVFEHPTCDTLIASTNKEKWCINSLAFSC